MIENSTTYSMKKSIPIDDLFSMWNVYSSMENQKRLKNRSRRLWQHQEKDIKVSPMTTIVPSSVLIISSLSSHSTFGPQTPSPIVAPGNPTSNSHLIYQHHVLSENPSTQNDKRRTNKFYVDDSDESDQGEEMDNESLWSTIHDDHYLEEAYQRNQVQPVLSAPPGMENYAGPLDPPSTTNQKQSYSLLSRLIQSSPLSEQQQQQNTYDILPPQLQSCVDWEKYQNSIRYRLGDTPDLPNENIIW